MQVVRGQESKERPLILSESIAHFRKRKDCARMQGITSVQNPLLQFVVIQIRKESVSSGKLEQPLKRCSISNHIPVPLFYIFLNYCRDELIGFSRTGFY